MSLLPEDHVYSFTQLQSFDECRYAFYMKRIEEREEEATNAFAEKGSLIHTLLDEWAKGLLSKQDMIVEYDRRYGEQVQSAWPRMMKGYAQKAYQQGYEFLRDFDEFAGYEILMAEEKYNSEIELSDGTTRPFVGVIDLIVKDESNDDIIIFDHKSKGKQSFKKSENEMYMQLYMYAKYVKEKFGKWPAALGFHLFNQEGLKVLRPFDEKEYKKTMKWAADRIELIESSSIVDMLECKEKPDFYCHELCPYRKETCPMGQYEPPKKKKDFDDYYDSQK